ncbi:transcriptional regulator with XRE-family HTH domain [Ralstonia sp. 151470066-2]|jgi:transcriptional regulator with XRE-family HTH domain|uniref:HTH cro/C1-type domain-containing protein n=1 Tax=Ralstonia thomasii TaxID=3058596 RepID=A0AAD2F2B9_9RALS|nr:hypothetical protein TK49_22760 [Ralstonia mannitolilytica]MDH6644610.1 transcriptional regulator with XRE-family HTH domain [Ralstonia sp. GP73]CAJ0804395.1 hypothetical protein R77560_04066 [Ralstonia sp. LMG 18095]
MQPVRGKKLTTGSVSLRQAKKSQIPAVSSAHTVTKGRGARASQGEEFSEEPANLLAQRINVRRLESGQSLADLTIELGVSYSYLVSVLSNAERARSISREFVVRIANYLNVSVAQVYIWAGILTAQDFFEPDELKAAMDRAFHAMQEDKANLLCPSYAEWNKLSIKDRQFIVRLYERASKTHFLPALRMPKIGK